MKLFKNKYFIFIFSFVLIFLFLFQSYSFGANTIIASDNNKYNIPDFNENMKNTTYYGYLCFIENNGRQFNVYLLLDENGFFYNSNSIYYYGRVMICNSSGGEYSTRIDGNSNESTYLGTKLTSSSVIYSTVDIYSNVDKTEVFFHPVTEVVIPALETAEQIPEAIMITLKILIPVGLIVLGIGLIIYLIKRVIYSVQ